MSEINWGLSPISELRQPLEHHLDGEMLEAHDNRPIVLWPTAPVPFLRLAA